MPVNRQRVAIILPLELEYSSRLLEGALDYARRRRSLAVIDIPYRVDSPSDLEIPSTPDFDAALFWATREASWVGKLLTYGIPLVSASGDWPADQIPSIAFSSQALVDVAISHLAALQPKSLLYLDHLITGAPRKEERARLFLQAAHRAGINAQTAEVFRPGDACYSAAASRIPLPSIPKKRLIKLLSSLSPPTAIWCGEDSLGIAVCEAAESIGLRIPDDAAVLGLGNFRLAECAATPLSTIPLPGEIIGHQALAYLDARLGGKTKKLSTLRIHPPPILARQTTTRGPTQDPISRAIALIAHRACEGITVKEVAAAVSLSPQTLHSRFLQQLGRSPGEEIRRNKLATAKRHLNDPRISITRAADLSGFSELSKFTNFFKRETGLNPRQWRQQQGNATP